MLHLCLKAQPFRPIRSGKTNCISHKPSKIWFLIKHAAGMTLTTTTCSSLSTQVVVAEHIRTSLLDSTSTWINQVPIKDNFSKQKQDLLTPIGDHSTLTRSPWGSASFVSKLDCAVNLRPSARNRSFISRAMLGDSPSAMGPSNAVAPRPPQASTSLTFISSGEDETSLLAQLLAKGAQPGDVLCLYGQVGAGKSVFSRAFVQAVVGDPDLVVPSPTFLLQQVYEDHPGTPVHHFDLYRLNGPTENFERLGLEDSFDTAISLIEWPECLGANLPEEHLDIHIDMASPEASEQVLSLQNIARSQETKLASESLPGELLKDSRESEADCDDNGIPEGLSDEEYAEDETYSDKRPRRFVLRPHGERWATRLRDLATRT